MNEQLDRLLTDCSKESLLIGHHGPATDALNMAIGGDIMLQKSAWEVIANDSQVKERDHLARWRLSLLTRALADV